MNDVETLVALLKARRDESIVPDYIEGMDEAAHLVEAWFNVKREPAYKGVLRECAERIRTLVRNAEAMAFTVIEPGQPRRHGSQVKVQLADLARLEGVASMIDELLTVPVNHDPGE